MMASFPTCEGSGREVDLLIENDWWVGTTTRCPVCIRGGLKPTRANKVPRHKDYSQQPKLLEKGPTT